MKNPIKKVVIRELVYMGLTLFVLATIGIFLFYCFFESTFTGIILACVCLPILMIIAVYKIFNTVMFFISLRKNKANIMKDKCIKPYKTVKTSFSKRQRTAMIITRILAFILSFGIMCWFGFFSLFFGDAVAEKIIKYFDASDFFETNFEPVDEGLDLSNPCHIIYPAIGYDGGKSINVIPIDSPDTDGSINTYINILEHCPSWYVKAYYNERLEVLKRGGVGKDVAVVTIDDQTGSYVFKDVDVEIRDINIDGVTGHYFVKDKTMGILMRDRHRVLELYVSSDILNVNKDAVLKAVETYLNENLNIELNTIINVLDNYVN